MSRGPEQKDINWEAMKDIVEDLGLVSTEEIRKEYNKREDDNLSWNTVKNRMEERDEFTTKQAGGFEMWEIEDEG